MSVSNTSSYIPLILNNYVYPESPKAKPLALRIADAGLTFARFGFGGETVEVTHGGVNHKGDQRVKSAFLRTFWPFAIFTLLLLPTLVCLAIKAYYMESQWQNIKGIPKEPAPLATLKAARKEEGPRLEDFRPLKCKTEGIRIFVANDMGGDEGGVLIYVLPSQLSDAEHLRLWSKLQNIPNRQRYYEVQYGTPIQGSPQEAIVLWGIKTIRTSAEISSFLKKNL